LTAVDVLDTLLFSTGSAIELDELCTVRRVLEIPLKEAVTSGSVESFTQ
jgi:hypothetical protein